MWAEKCSQIVLHVDFDFIVIKGNKAFCFIMVDSLCLIVSQSVQSLSRVRLFATPWIAARQASLTITNSQSLLKAMPIKSVMPSSHLILCRPLLLLPSIPPTIRVFSNESTLRMRWAKYWSFSLSISPSSEHPTRSEKKQHRQWL